MLSILVVTALSFAQPAALPEAVDAAASESPVMHPLVKSLVVTAPSVALVVAGAGVASVLSATMLPGLFAGFLAGGFTYLSLALGPAGAYLALLPALGVAFAVFPGFWVAGAGVLGLVLALAGAGAPSLGQLFARPFSRRDPQPISVVAPSLAAFAGPVVGVMMMGVAFAVSTAMLAVGVVTSNASSSGDLFFNPLVVGAFGILGASFFLPVLGAALALPIQGFAAAAE